MPNNSSHLDLIADAFGLSCLPKAVRDSLIEEIDEMVFRSVLFRVMIEMNNDDKEELHDVLDSAGDDFEKPYAFLKDKVKNLDELIKEELEKVKEESLMMTQSFA
jgi:UDP-glucose 6-dehydrogenase